MEKPVVQVENLSKLFHLGTISSLTLRDSLHFWWNKKRGRDHLSKKIGQSSLMIGPDHPQTGPFPNTFWALKDLNFEVKQGEIVGIIGKNGAGKSTLLKILSHITDPTEGRAVLRGRVGSLLEVGTGFHPELTGRENIYLNGAILGMKTREIECKFDDIVQFAEIEKFIDTPVKRYSSGMYVRLAFAVAAHLEPEILIVDEVLAVGDAEFQRKCLGKMGDVAKSGRTVLFVSHNMAAVRALCSRGILLKDGRNSEMAGIDKIIESYNSFLEFDSSNAQVIRTPGAAGISFAGIQLSAQSVNRSNKSCEDTVFRINLEADEDCDGVVVTIGINTILGQRIAVLHSEMSGYEISLEKGLNTVVCSVPDNRLVKGQYWLDLDVYRKNERIFYINNCSKLIVAENDFFKTGRTTEESWIGVVHLDQIWKTNSPSASSAAQNTEQQV